MLPVKYDARSTQRELDKLKREVDRVDALAVGPTGPAGPTGPQGSVGLQGPAGLGAIDVLDEDDMISNADNKLATQQSIKAYVDSKQDLVFKPSDYGAVGDGGSTDDIIAIKAMIVDVKANGGGTVDLEEKVYGVSETVAFGVPIRLLCGKKAGFKAKNSISTFSEITNRAGNTQPVDPDDSDSPTYRVLFDIKDMAYSSFEGLFELSSVGGTSAMGGQVNYVPNLIAITQQDGTGPVQALNGYFESLYVTKLHAAFFQPFKTIGTGPVLPYTRTWFARLEIIKCYQAWNFQHVNGFDDCAVGILRVNKCAEDAYAKAFDLNCVEAFFAGGKATEDDTFSTTAGSTAFTTSTTGVVSVGDRVLVKGAETYGQGFCTKIATYSGTSGTFEDVCPVTTTNAEFIFGAGGFLMDRATFVCGKLYLEGAYQKLFHFTRQGTLTADTLKFSTGEFGCYKGRPIVFEHINSNCHIGSIPAGEQGVNGNPLTETGLGKLVQSYIYYGLRKYTDIQIPPPDPDTGLPLPDEDNTYDFYPNHNCSVSLMMTKPVVENYGINPIEVGHTIYDSTGFAGGIREWSTSKSQLTVNYSDATVKVSGNIGGKELYFSADDGINVTAFGAIGDGVIDDTLAVQAAIDYAETLAISPQGTPPVVFPSGRYRVKTLTVKKATIKGSGAFGCTLIWEGDANGTMIQWEARYHKSFSGFRFESGDNSPKMWIDCMWVSSSDIIPKLDWGDNFYDLFFTQTANVTDACHMNLPKIINCYMENMRFQAAPHLIRIQQFTTASANRVFAIRDWTVDFNQLPDEGVKSLFKVDMIGNASLTLSLQNARIETRNNQFGTDAIAGSIVELHNSFADAFTAGSQSFTSTASQVDYTINTAPDDVDYGDQLKVYDDGVLLARKLYSYEADTKVVTLTTAPATGSTVLIEWSPFTMPVNGISLDMRDMGIQLTKTVNGSQVSQEANLIRHSTTQTNVTSDIQMQNVYLDGFDSLYGGNWSTDYSTPNPSDLTTNVRLKFWSTGRMSEKMSQQLGDYVKLGDAVQFHREAANSLSMAGVGTDVAMTLDVHGDLNVSNNTGGTKAGFTGSTGALRIGNSASGTTLGTVTKKIEVFNENGASLGFMPVYSTIT